MTNWPALDAFLATDPRDVGCDEAMAMLHVYVDLVDRGAAADGQLSGVAVHLQACGPCGEDYAGLLAAVQANRL